mmetsp:Transcript_12692/g.23180  ORF Transcript_12692/g.23180 Transcript_12692/m.23180 type:complete len:217 (-) Transcript_12692:213-863(-)
MEVLDPNLGLQIRGSLPNRGTVLLLRELHGNPALGLLLRPLLSLFDLLVLLLQDALLRGRRPYGLGLLDALLDVLHLPPSLGLPPRLAHGNLLGLAGDTHSELVVDALDSFGDFGLGGLHSSDLVGLNFGVLSSFLDGLFPGVVEGVSLLLPRLPPAAGLPLGLFEPLLLVLQTSLSELFVFEPLGLRFGIEGGLLGDVKALFSKVCLEGFADGVH